MMGQFEQLDQMLTAQEGMLRTSQVVSSGISKPVFYDYVRSRDLDRVAHGIYLSKDSWVDAMYLLHLRFEQAVFSHETALFFHDLTDREPIEYTVTVKTGCNPSKMKAEGIQVFTIKADLHDVGLTTAKTPFGHTVPVYDMNKYIGQQFAALRYEKNILVVEETTSAGGCGSFNAASSCPASACLYDSAAWGFFIV